MRQSPQHSRDRDREQYDTEPFVQHEKPVDGTLFEARCNHRDPRRDLYQKE
jgi:hypothetical protein